MLTDRLIVKTAPQADAKNFVYWMDYRVTVLSDRLFRIERNDKHKYRDCATQAIWFRNMPPQKFEVSGNDFHAVIDTGACKLMLYRERGQVCVEINGEMRRLDNYGNLLGTYRTLDMCDGDVCTKDGVNEKIQLSKGVCSKTGVAVISDADSYSLDADGLLHLEKAEGSDEYVFAYGNDYRAAVKALYMLTGKTPLVPRFALGNWWSRYHAYTDKEYLRLLNAFEEKDIPLTVATVDMDWHYSDTVDEDFKVSEEGKNTEEYVGSPAVNMGWTGYTWNKNLFPDYKEFLKKVKAKNLRVTLNVHPSDGVRFWESCYDSVAGAMGQIPTEQKQVKFDFTYDRFINVYFDLIHRPYEADGVDFWWIDWQQPDIAWHDERPEILKQMEPLGAYDPLWALNHYHYLDNAAGKATPLILSRYAGIGSHRYPLGFSGDTEISWKTLAYLPYFTATASNVGYTWWSHDIGGHRLGEKSDELYLRHVQYGVFSPINRLHCASNPIKTKEPWAYGNGCGEIAETFLRFRHKMIPYLYTAAYRTAAHGEALVEPLYYEWDQKQAYTYKEEYLFGGQLLVVPATQKRYPDGYTRLKAWLPEGRWTDIFTGQTYQAGVGGKELTLHRDLTSIPVFAREGSILPLSADKGNSVKNPEKLEVWAYKGTGVYTLYEDGLEEGKRTSLFTEFKAEYNENGGTGIQSLSIFAHGDSSLSPENRVLTVRFKDLPADSKVTLFIENEEVSVEEYLTDCAAIRFAFDATKTYRIEVMSSAKDAMAVSLDEAREVLLTAEGLNADKTALWNALSNVKTVEEYLVAVDVSKVTEVTKLRLKEALE